MAKCNELKEQDEEMVKCKKQPQPFNIIKVNPFQWNLFVFGAT